MFNWAQRGPAASHRYRGFYDAGMGSDTHCAQCNRVIRHCYSLHDWTMKSFVIGTCCFHYYEGTDILDNLKAAQTLQAATKDAIVRDTRLYGALTTVQDRRKQWRRARRQAMSLLTKYRKEHGDWLPKELFDLAQTAIRVPRDYKRTAYALRWYANQTLMINSLIKDAEMVLLYRSI